jgi:hypothetical protein
MRHRHELVPVERLAPPRFGGRDEAVEIALRHRIDEEVHIGKALPAIMRRQPTPIPPRLVGAQVKASRSIPDMA